MKTFGRVWSKFESTRRDGEVLKLRIQDLPNDRIEDCLDIFEKYFDKEETFSKAVGVAQNPESLQESREMMAEMINDPDYHCVICCEDIEEGNFGQIAGISVMALTSTSSLFSDVEPATKEMEKLTTILKGLYEFYDPLKELQRPKMFDGRGIIVHPDYRKLGIASEFIKMRRKVCKEHKVPATGAWMTSTGSQKAAEKDSWVTVCDVKYEDLEKKFDVTFTDVPSTCKFMVARVDV